MKNTKKRIICFTLAICTLLFGCLFSGDREVRAFGLEEATNPFDMQITLNAEKPVNSEICTVEMLGTGNAARFVRCTRRSFGQNELRLYHVSFCPDNISSAIFKNYELQKNKNHILFFSDIVIVNYIHNQDGQK